MAISKTTNTVKNWLFIYLTIIHFETKQVTVMPAVVNYFIQLNSNIINNITLSKSNKVHR